jgi:tetratricopeptide (TPR) repeat protein
MMRAWIIGLVVATAGAIAHADGPAPDGPPADGHLAIGRALYEQGDYAGARSELLLAYQDDPQPQLLFALGQIEFHLENYQAAIDYYERFLASGPDEHDTSLAQQALGAARTALATPRPEPTIIVQQAPPIVTRRRWDRPDWALTVGGVVGIGAGAGMIAWGHHLSTDRSGSIMDYDARLGRARGLQWIGLGVSIAGVAAVATAIIRDGNHRERVEIGVSASGDQLGVTVSGPL